MAKKVTGNDSLAMDTGKKEYKGKKLRVAIIGCGGISQVHMGALQEMPEVEVVACCDILQERVDKMQEKWNIPQGFCDGTKSPWKKMLKEVQIDAIDICTPNYVHCAPAVDAANAGCHVMVEKPMAMTPAECEKMIAAAKKNNVKLAVGFQNRYDSKTQFLKRAKDAGEFGDIMFVKVQALRRRGIPNWGVFGQKDLQGGGPMIDIGVHMVEASHYFLGAPKPVAAMGRTWTYLGDKPSDVVCPWPGWDHKTYTVEDLAIGQIRFEDGSLMQIESSFAAHIEKNIFSFSFAGSQGGGSWDPPRIYTDRAGTMVDVSPNYLPTCDFSVLFKSKLQNWVDAIMKGTELTAPGEAGLMVQKILDAIYRSAAKGGKEVEIK